MGRKLSKEEFVALKATHQFGTPIQIISDVMPIKVEKITDKKYRFGTVGSIANVINGNERIIPMSVQKDAVEEWKRERWQLTSFIEHPEGDIRGSMKDVAGVCEIADFNEAGETMVNITLFETQEDGQRVKNLFDEGLEIGTSQRAIGIQSFREEADGGYFIVVDKIVRILGYDFCFLDSAATKGNRSALKVLDTVAVEKIQQLTSLVEFKQEEEVPMDAKELAALLDANNTKLLASITSLTDTFHSALAANSDVVPQDITDSFATLKTNVENLVKDTKLSADKKNAKLQQIATQMQAVVDTIAPKPAAAVEPVPAPATVEDADIVIGSITDTTNRIKAFVENSQKEKDAQAKAEKLAKYLLDSIAALEQPDDVKASLTDTLKTRQFDAEKDIDSAIDALTKLVGLGVATERAKAEGIKGKGTSVVDIVVVGDHLKGVAALCDQLIGTGYLTSKTEDVLHGKNRGPVVREFLKIYDTMYGAHLKNEADQILALNDATQSPADFTVPYTISRIILEEVYADYIIEGITDFGPMQNKRDQIPITKYTREGGLAGTQKTYKPSRARISELKVGEFAAMAKGKLATTWHNIDATPSKLQAAFSDEFATLSRRYQNITGVAKGIANLIADLRRSLQQMVFYNMRNAALSYNAVAFTYNGAGDGAHSIYTVCADHSISPADDFSVLVNGVAINEFEVSTTGVFFYVMDIANGKIQFVNADGTPSNVANGHAVVVAGRYATNENRFSLTPAAGVDWEKHMNKLLFLVTNTAAVHRQTRGYKPEMLLASEVTSNYMTQAQAYEAYGSRQNFNAPTANSEGNYGRTGNLAHFGSDVWDNEFMLLTQRDATIFRIFEPLILKGPFPTRNSDGALTSGEEYYVYQEDALTTPLLEKLSLVTVVA